MGKLPVEQEDRTGAADLLDELSTLLDHNGIGQVADLIRDGEYDEHEATQAFARHRIEATPAVDREAAREAIARKLCEQHGADPDAVAREEHDCWDGPLWTVFLKDADAIMALPPVKQSDGLAERVREACAKVAEAHCVGLRGIGPVGRAQVNEARRIASAIRSLDITRMDSDG